MFWCDQTIIVLPLYIYIIDQSPLPRFYQGLWRNHLFNLFSTQLTYSDYSQLFSDQFGFRPVGSTKGALIYLFHQVSLLLQHHDYVHIIGLNFSKVLDSVRHYSLTSELDSFPISDCIYNWIIDCLCGRQHQTKVGGQKSIFWL